jgi:NADPH:quinone reductase-like Zn-dependent oxidoreductase
MTLPERMRALVLRHGGVAATRTGPGIADLGDWVSLAEIPLPVPGRGQALIRVARAAVNPSDLHFIKGEYGRPRVAGAPAGFEGTGTVVAGDTPLLGRRVSFFAGGSGSWAEYALADGTTLVPLRDDLRDEDAAGLLVNPLTALAMFDLVREDGAGAFVLTAGGSQLGKLLIGLGAEAGIAPVAIVRRDGQVGPLRALGAAEVLVAGASGFAAAFAAIVQSRKPRILLDAVADQLSADLFFAMPNRARWVIYGRLSPEGPRLTEPGQFVFRMKRIEGFWLSPWLGSTPPERVASVVAEAQARFADGRWRTDIAATVPLAEAMTALPAALRIPDGKVLIAP